MSNATISTNEIYVGENTELLLTDKLDQHTNQINNLASYKAPNDHIHSEFNYVVQSKVKTLNLTESNGSFSIVDTGEVYREGGRYLVSIKYTNGNALVDQSLYMFTYSTAKKLCSTFNLVKCVSSNDTLLATQTNGVVTFAAQYVAGGATGCTITFI